MMINFDTIKQTAIKAINGEVFSNESEEKNRNNKIIATALLIKTVMTLTEKDRFIGDSTMALAKSYAKSYKSISESLEGKFVSYKKLVRYIQNSNITNLKSLSYVNMEDIFTIYSNKIEIKPFKLNEFSQYMYNLTDLSEYELSRLNKVHFNVIVPIMGYFIDKYDVREDDISIEDVSEGEVGKIIDLSIQNIDNTKIVSMLNQDVLGLKNFIYSTRLTVNGYIEIVIK